MVSWLSKFEKNTNFTPNEALRLYRLAATAEAIGWTILITGIAIKKYQLPGHIYSVSIAGQIHGILFLLYFTLTAFIYPSLNLSRIKILFAFIAGIIPYGTLAYEFYLSSVQKYSKETNQVVSLLYKKGDKILAMQPHKGIDWQLPSLPLKIGESPTEGANRLLNTFFNKSSLKVVPYISETDKIIFSVPSLHLSASDISKATSSPYVDELLLITEREAPSLFKY